jgi:hypothetical protein
MSSTADLNSETIFSADGKYHLTLVYLVHDDGSCGGGYVAEYFKWGAGVGGESIDKMIDEAYDIFEGYMEDEDQVPFRIKNIKESVVFDLVECLNEEEQLTALDMRTIGTSYQEINKAVLK